MQINIKVRQYILQIIISSYFQSYPSRNDNYLARTPGI